MAEVKNTQKTGSEITNLAEGRTSDRDVSSIRKTRGKTVSGSGTGSGSTAEARTGKAGVGTPGTVGTDAVAGKDGTQLEAAKRLGALGGASATERLLGLDLRPTMPGALVSPPGNIDFLRRLSPTMRRTMMRNMLQRQREKMKRLARFLKRERDSRGGGRNADDDRELLAEFGDLARLSPVDIERSIDELGRSARMLDILDELLVLQDHTISQMGTFAQG